MITSTTAKRRCIWIPDELWQKIRGAAEQEGRSISNWVRHVLDEATKQDPPQTS